MTTKNFKNRPSNYIILTVQVARDSEGVKLTPKGDSLAKVRAFKSMGKDSNGEYKPSLWVDLMHWNEGDAPDEIAEALGNLEKGANVTVKGRIAYEEWTGDDGVTHPSFSVWVQSIEPFVYDNASPAQAEAEAEEDEVDLI